MQIRTLGSVAVQSPNPMVYQATLERGTNSTRDKLCRKPVAVSYPRVPKGEQDQKLPQHVVGKPKRHAAI